MKKTISLMATAIVSTVLLAGCQNMSPSDQRIGAAALGGAVGGGHVGFLGVLGGLSPSQVTRSGNSASRRAT